MPFPTLRDETITRSYFERKNRLRNGCQRIWQRGTSISNPTDATYTVDGWKFLTEVNSDVTTVAREATTVPTNGSRYSLKATTKASNTSKFGFFQIIEGQDMWDLRGGKASLQIKAQTSSGITHVRMAIINWTSTEDSPTVDPISVWGAEGTNPTLAANYSYTSTPVDLAITTTFQTFVLENQDISASANNLGVFIWSDDKTNSTDTLIFTDAQLEAGPVCTSFERRLIETEFYLNLRFFERLNAPAINTIFGSGGNTSATNAYLYRQMAGRKRVSGGTFAVGATVSSDFSLINVASGGPVICTTITAIDVGIETIFIQAQVASGLTSGGPSLLVSQTGNAFLSVSTEI